MRKILSWFAIGLGGLAALAAVLLIVATVNTNSRAARVYDAPWVAIAIPTDAASIDLGRHFYTIRGCIGCHGENLAGGVMFDVGPLGTVTAANLTRGENGITARYSDAEIARAIRFGVKADGTSVFVMPSAEMTGISDEEVGQLIAYIRSVPPVDTEPVVQRWGWLGRILVLFGQLPAYSAEAVDMTLTPPASVAPAAAAEYGAYLAIACTGCHNPAYSGGPLPGAQEGEPPALNLTPGGELIGWTLEDFKTAMTTGLTPSGRHLRAEYMPWPDFAEMTATELEAVWLFLQSLPAKEFEER
ncbi:MAG: cytochrome c [Chloroflexi bacterium]|nr:cytochrome c [Chloroflexota bacterium]